MEGLAQAMAESIEMRMENEKRWASGSSMGCGTRTTRSHYHHATLSFFPTSLPTIPGTPRPISYHHSRHAHHYTSHFACTACT
jgi:hypothetical protein